jgi:hypothetical protein
MGKNLDRDGQDGSSVKTSTEPMPLWILKAMISQSRYELWVLVYHILIYQLAPGFGITEYVRWFTFAICAFIIGAPWRAWPISQHRSRTGLRCLCMVVWASSSISSPAPYGVGLSDYTRCVFSIIHHSSLLILWLSHFRRCRAGL